MDNDLVLDEYHLNIFNTVPKYIIWGAWSNVVIGINHQSYTFYTREELLEFILSNRDNKWKFMVWDISRQILNESEWRARAIEYENGEMEKKERAEYERLKQKFGE